MGRDLRIPSAIYDVVHPIAEKYDVPDYVWQSIVLMESGGNPSAKNVTSREASYGLFQLNTKGGQGSGYDPSFLLDPKNNAEIGLKPIADAYKKGLEQGLKDSPELAGWVAGHSGHNGYNIPMTDPVIQKVVKFAKDGERMNEFAELGKAFDPLNSSYEAYEGIPSPTDIVLSLWGKIAKIGVYLILFILILVSMMKILDISPIPTQNLIKGVTK